MNTTLLQKSLVALIITVWSLPGLAQNIDDLPPYPRIEVKTNAGDMVFELFTSRAPLHVRTMLRLVDEEFYDNTIFHRVVGGFVVQGGGYDTEYNLKPTEKVIPNESGNGLNNRRGYIGMARTGDPHSADSQFYINLSDNLALDPQPTRWGYTVIGKVVEGMEVVDEIGYRATGSGPKPELAKDVPVEPIVILSARVIASPESTDSAPPGE